MISVYFYYKSFPILNYYKCPKNHTYKSHYFQPNNYTDLTCDLCLKESKPKGSHMVDIDCNLCFCLDCIKDEKAFVHTIQED